MKIRSACTICQKLDVSGSICFSFCKEIKKLKSEKKYYVRIRACKVDSAGKKSIGLIAKPIVKSKELLRITFK